MVVVFHTVEHANNELGFFIQDCISSFLLCLRVELAQVCLLECGSLDLWELLQHLLEIFALKAKHKELSVRLNRILAVALEKNVILSYHRALR